MATHVGEKSSNHEPANVQSIAVHKKLVPVMWPTKKLVLAMMPILNTVQMDQGIGLECAKLNCLYAAWRLALWLFDPVFPVYKSAWSKISFPQVPILICLSTSQSINVIWRWQHQKHFRQYGILYRICSLPFI